MQHRVGRLEQEIQREINDLLLKQVRDPRVQGITITGVEVTGDLQQATIYFSILADQASAATRALAGLNHAKGLIRRELGHRLSIYKTPEIFFKQDQSIRYGEHIDQLLKQLHEREQ